MDFQTYVPLITSAIDFSGKILSRLIAKPKDDSRPSLDKEEISGNQQAFNKVFLEDIITNTTQRFSKLLDTNYVRIVTEMKEQKTREAIQEVQARVTALKRLLDVKQMDEKIAVQLVIGALNPLQVSLEIARLRLTDYKKEWIWEYCNVIGTGALIAGYAYIGQDMPDLKAELELSMQNIQLQILDEIATIIVPTQSKIPWKRVPILITPEGVNELSELYIATIEKVKEFDREVKE